MDVKLYLSILCGGAVIYLLIYMLYCRGIAILRRTVAVIFIFRHGKNADKATLDSCTGWVRHVGRFHESKTYEFFFDAQLSRGNVEVILLDRKKQQLMKLTPQSPICKIGLDAGNRYYLRWEFMGATGKCELRWQGEQIPAYGAE